MASDVFNIPVPHWHVACFMVNTESHKKESIGWMNSVGLKYSPHKLGKGLAMATTDSNQNATKRSLPSLKFLHRQLMKEKMR